MEWLFKALLLALAAGLLAVTLEKIVPGIALLLSISVSVLILLLAAALLDPILSFLRELSIACGVSGIYTAPLLKCLCIALITRFGVSLSKDANQSGAASALELAGSVAAVWTILPLLKAFLSMLEELL